MRRGKGFAYLDVDGDSEGGVDALIGFAAAEAGVEPEQLADAATRRAHFGGTAAPWFRLALDGARAAIVTA